jgi:glyoxylase-like metal-dependent hydrolase (beta-lactamase superfamily II)
MGDHVVPGCVQVRLGLVNAFLVDSGGDSLVMVDAGVPWAFHRRRLMAAIGDAGRKPADLGDILITHQHIDHAGGAAGIVAATGARVHIHELDAPEVEAGSRPRPGTGRSAFTSLIAKSSRVMKLGRAKVDHYPADGESLAGSLGIQAIHTPGHTLGHTSYLWPAHGGVLFAGDALANFRGRRHHAPVAHDWDQVVASIAKLAEYEYRTVVFGHGRILRDNAVAEVRRFAEFCAG